MASHVAIGVPTEVLIAPEDFSGAFTAAGGRGGAAARLAASGQPARVSPAVDARESGGEGHGPPVTEIRAARAVITGMGCLDRHGLIGTFLSAVATSRPPVGRALSRRRRLHRLDLFELRILDLQLVLEATTSPMSRRPVPRSAPRSKPTWLAAPDAVSERRP